MAIGDFMEKLANQAGWDGSCAEVGTSSSPVTPVATAVAIVRQSGSSTDRMDRLVRTIEGEIVPRLVMARRLPRSVDIEPRAGGKAPDALDVSELVRLLLAHDVGVASAYVETVRQRGATLERICMDLLAPAARELGSMWERDECDFMQVTVGLCRLHQLLRELSPEFRVEDERLDKGNRRILLVPCPGDQHTFGVSLVAQFLRRAGWDVWHEFPAVTADILEIVSNHWLAVIGLSVGTQAQIEEVSALIRAIRGVSRNRAIGVLVGGPVLVGRPELALEIGADATAADGPQAVLRAEHVINSLSASN